MVDPGSSEWEGTAPSSVSLDELTIVPARYAEEESLLGRRAITMTVVLDDESTRSLRAVLAAKTPVRVVRHGLGAKPLVMHPGHAVHSVLPDGTTKTRFAMSEPGADDGVSAMEVFAATLGNAISLAARERTRSDALVRVLVEKSVLTESEAAAIAARDVEAEIDVRYSLSEVEDADDGWI